MHLKYHVITVSNTHPGELVYLVDFDPCARHRDLYLGHAFVLLDWVAEDDRFDTTPWIPAARSARAAGAPPRGPGTALKRRPVDRYARSRRVGVGACYATAFIASPNDGKILQNAVGTRRYALRRDSPQQDRLQPDAFGAW